MARAQRSLLFCLEWRSRERNVNLGLINADHSPQLIVEKLLRAVFDVLREPDPVADRERDLPPLEHAEIARLVKRQLFLDLTKYNDERNDGGSRPRRGIEKSPQRNLARRTRRIRHPKHQRCKSVLETLANNYKQLFLVCDSECDSGILRSLRILPVLYLCGWKAGEGNRTLVSYFP